MENTTGWALMQQIPPVNLVNPVVLPPQLPYPSAQQNTYYYPSPQNPNPSPLLSGDSHPHDAVIHPPGVEPDAVSHISSVPEIQQPVPTYTYLQTHTVVSSSTAAHYYHDPNVQVAFAGITVPATVTDNSVSANATSSLLINQTAGPRKHGIGRKGPKKIKIAQSAWCEICKVDCNSKSVLDQHKLGKKHKKNLEKLIAGNACISIQGTVPAQAQVQVPASAHTPSNSLPPPSTDSVIAPNGNLDKAISASGQKSQKKAAEAEDLETKRRKILEGGATAKDVRMCTVCNVVCNSETVFRYHLAGQKHATMLKKRASMTGMANTTCW